MPQAHSWLCRRMVQILSWWKEASITSCKGDTGIYPSWGFSSVYGNAVGAKWPVGTDWERSQSREPLSLWISSGNDEGNRRYLWGHTAIRGMGYKKNSLSYALVFWYSLQCPHKLPLGGSARGPRWTKTCSCAGKKPSQNEFRWFLQEPHVLTAWFKEKNKVKKPNLLLAGMFLLSEDNLLVMLHLQLIWSEIESSHTLTDLHLEEQTRFAVIFIMVSGTPTPGISECTSSAFLVSRSRFCNWKIYVSCKLWFF